MNDEYRDVAAVFERITPGGPRPEGWAARARRRSRARRAAVGVSAVAAFALLAAPLAMSLGDLGPPSQNAMPADPVTEEPWEPPTECTGDVQGLVTDGELGDVVAGVYCWDSGGEGLHAPMDSARQLHAEEVDVIVAALEASRGHAADPLASCLATWCPDPNIAQIWLTTDDGKGIAVTEQVDGRLLWSEPGGGDWMYPAEPMLPNDDPYVRAALDGVLAFSRAVNVEHRSACWVEQEPAEADLGTATSGHLCDPTGTTVAEIERPVPADVVTLVVDAAASELEPVGEQEPAIPTGWSLTLLHDDDRVSWLNQLADGSFAYQDPQGGEWQWTPSGEAAAVLQDLGVAHLR